MKLSHLVLRFNTFRPHTVSRIQIRIGTGMGLIWIFSYSYLAHTQYYVIVPYFVFEVD